MQSVFSVLLRSCLSVAGLLLHARLLTLHWITWSFMREGDRDDKKTYMYTKRENGIILTGLSYFFLALSLLSSAASACCLVASGYARLISDTDRRLRQSVSPAGAPCSLSLSLSLYFSLSLSLSLSLSPLSLSLSLYLYLSLSLSFSLSLSLFLDRAEAACSIRGEGTDCLHWCPVSIY
jgi:hypothetical protein